MQTNSRPDQRAPRFRGCEPNSRALSPGEQPEPLPTVNGLVSVSRHRGPGGAVVTAAGRAVILGVPAGRRSTSWSGRVQRPACTVTLTPAVTRAAGAVPANGLTRTTQCSIPRGSKDCPSWPAHPPLRGRGRARGLCSETVSPSRRACLGGTQPPGVHSVVRMLTSTTYRRGRGARGPTCSPCGYVGQRFGEADAGSLPSSLPRSRPRPCHGCSTVVNPQRCARALVSAGR